MSVIGTGIAAGVANSALQSQQVARNRDKQRNETANDTRLMRELFETRLRALEEGDQTPTQLRIGDEVPQHEPPKQSPDQFNATETQPASEQPVESAAPDTSPDSPLYRHLDIQA